MFKRSRKIPEVNVVQGSLFKILKQEYINASRRLDSLMILKTKGQQNWLRKIQIFKNENMTNFEKTKIVANRNSQNKIKNKAYHVCYINIYFTLPF